MTIILYLHSILYNYDFSYVIKNHHHYGRHRLYRFARPHAS
ncbi:hypothetical protein [Arachidicoccus ginsenosidimutans]|nr:hypothetical protein [Arachidicoccus sp. BS20]